MRNGLFVCFLIQVHVKKQQMLCEAASTTEGAEIQTVMSLD